MKTIFDEMLCAGFGMYDTRIKSGTDYEQISVLDVLTRYPSSAPKSNASWVLPSAYSRSDARSHETQRQHGRFCLLSADIDSGNHPLAKIDEAIVGVVGVDVARRIYSTSSSKEQNKKWRIIIPVEKAMTYQNWSMWEKCLNFGLEAAGIIPDKVMERSAQPIFLPNTKAGSYYENALLGNDELSPQDSEVWNTNLKEFKERKQAEREAIEALKAIAPTKPKIPSSKSVIDVFNATYSIELLLSEYGYIRSGTSDSWRSPHQSSNSYATKNFGDYWVSLSGSDAAIGLGVSNQFGCAGDAFSLYCFYEHNGDHKKAVKELTK